METTVHTGDLIAATFTIPGGTFHKSVVLVCDHNDEQGTYGLVLNHPLELDEESMRALPFPCPRLFQGGPVQPEAMQILHPYGKQLEGAHKVGETIWVGGDFARLTNGMQTGEFNAEECRFFIGYAGWSEGQLAEEFEQMAWLRVPGDLGLIGETPARQLWSATIRRYGQKHPIFANYPDELATN
ncbi:MAG: YqgE/AlgH family protein [Lentisphaeria bacterium]|nr:YqgE/AlgH family protein [Lentisphaeria bacterium]